MSACKAAELCLAGVWGDLIHPPSHGAFLLSDQVGGPVSVFVYPALFLQREEMRLTYNPPFGLCFLFPTRRFLFCISSSFWAGAGGGEFPFCVSPPRNEPFPPIASESELLLRERTCPERLAGHHSAGLGEGPVPEMRTLRSLSTMGDGRERGGVLGTAADP